MTTNRNNSGFRRDHAAATGTGNCNCSQRRASADLAETGLGPGHPGGAGPEDENQFAALYATSGQPVSTISSAELPLDSV